MRTACSHESFWRALADEYSRRRFLRLAGLWGAATLWAQRPMGAVLARPKFSAYPFSLGVASGDPSPQGFVIWTRLAPDPLNGGGMPDQNVEVQWRVANDEGFSDIVAKGTTVATPEWAHSVHVEIEGLQPARTYWYQFDAGEASSPIGRTRTNPLPESMPDRLRFAVASCQHWESGFYTAYERMAEDDVDLVLHLGDYIYEGPGTDAGTVRRHVGGELQTLSDYRNRHAQYKTDPALQAMHASVPWLVTWDDHEVDNNYAGAISEDTGAEGGIEPFLVRRACAYQAYYEHMPLRRTSLPHGPDMRVYRGCDFGRLASFQVLDTRQYRTDQPCGDRLQVPCEGTYDPQATLLGAEQEAWLVERLLGSSATWNVLAQQVMMATVDMRAGSEQAYSMDQWPGYEVNRQRLLKFLQTRRIANPLVLTGDIHAHWANELTLPQEETPIATELVATSISSGGNGLRVPNGLATILAENPCVKFHNSERGYVRCEMTPEESRVDYRVVEYVTRPGAPLLTRASFAIEAGNARMLSI